MRYACLVYVDTTKLDLLADGELSGVFRESAACEADFASSGYLLMAGVLEGGEVATTVRVRDGCLVVMDGPVTDSGEQLARLLMIEARDLNEVMRLAGNHPLGRLGRIEIRPVRSIRGNAGTSSG